MIEIRPIPAASTHALRHAVLRPHQTIEEMVYDCDALRETVHFGAFGPEDDAPIGIVTLLVNEREGVRWQLRGMATDPAVRGSGAGRRLVEACVAHAGRSPNPGIWCNARTSAARFYERRGFGVVSDEFNIPGIGPHVVMLRPGL